MTTASTLPGAENLDRLDAVPAVAAVAPDAPLETQTISRRAVGPRDVRIAIEYSGICHSDIHTARSEWSEATYPLVVGHEIVGRVDAVGSDVTKFSVGDRVGVGCMSNSCHDCPACADGQEQECHNGTIMTYGGVDVDGSITQGGYSAATVIDERMVLRIPESLPADAAAPLLCAGITMYSPLRQWNAGAGTKVAIIGMGGLGHVGVKLAAAMGCEVTVLSQTTSKREDSLRFGATEHFATGGEEGKENLKSLRGSFDLIINTVSANLPMDAYVGLLRTRGVFVEIGLPIEKLSLSAFTLTHARRVLTGSLIGGIPETQEMLDFCAEHGVTAEIELISASEINSAYERVVASDVRYRFVIDASTF
ncbi:MAG TPA: NAD(P)-dependent alcohol dehydrogenase [Dietzia timorensis]|uniref:alcohol dehydrogenase (NADP(+)) n=1 Tax=Dietzia timorensis TaxID=499555 RepID=A0A921F4N2_9ACTN|nr:NAD(P)-dependent alcohol dehydrogenase [Dietzia timorensis]HJE91162.1 NAD(P)-dependent alcohol dehydrogenase [Dietzia timorensis]